MKRESVPLAGYDTYMQRGPPIQAGYNDSTTQIELTRLDYNRTTDNLPLLPTLPGGDGNYRSGMPSLPRYGR